MKKCIIIGSAPCSSLDFLADELYNSYVIVADGGIKTALREGIVPQLFIGDMDSCDGILPENLPRMILPCEKDYSDIHTAVVYAIEQGYQEIVLTGCTNGRADHYFANVMLLELIAIRGAHGVILDGQNKIMFFGGGTISLTREERYPYVSIIALDAQVSGVTLTGLRYPLNNAVLSRYEPIAISNEPIGDLMEITICEGRVLIILSGDAKK